MQFNQNTFSINRKYLFVLLPLLFIVVSFVVIVMNSCNDYDSAKREILIRRIGHELLLQSGDTISRVLPIEKISKNEYQIKFENELTFQTAFLVKITKKNIN